MGERGSRRQGGTRTTHARRPPWRTDPGRRRLPLTLAPLRRSYLQEYRELGTAGGLLHFRDQIKAGEPNAFFLLHSNLCCDFPLEGETAS